MDLTSQVNRDNITIEKIIKNNHQDDYYSNKQDCKIIKFFEENMEFLELKNEEKVYEMLQNKYLFQNTTTSLQNRFINTILPNLYKYPVLSYSRMILFYDRAGLEIPAQLQRLICEKIEKQESFNDITIVNKSKEYTKNLAEYSCQNLTDKYDYNFEFSSIASQLCICVKKVQHIFLLKNEPNIKNIKRCLIQEHGILRSNIHLLNQKVFQFLNEYKKHSNVFKYEIMNIIKPFLELSEPIDVDSFCENKQIAKKVVDLDKTKIKQLDKSKNLKESDIFYVSIKPKIKKRKNAKVLKRPVIKLQHSTVDMNNIFTEPAKKQPIFSELVDDHKQKSINIDNKGKLMKSLEKQVIRFIDSRSKYGDNLPVKPSHADDNKIQKETVKRVQKPIDLVNSGPKNVDDFSVKPDQIENDKIPIEISPHLDVNKKVIVNNQESIIKTQLCWLENPRKRKYRFQIDTNKMLNNIATDNKPLSNVTLQRSTKSDLNSSFSSVASQSNTNYDSNLSDVSPKKRKIKSCSKITSKVTAESSIDSYSDTETKQCRISRPNGYDVVKNHSLMSINNNCSDVLEEMPVINHKNDSFKHNKSDAGASKCKNKITKQLSASTIISESIIDSNNSNEMEKEYNKEIVSRINIEHCYCIKKELIPQKVITDYAQNDLKIAQLTYLNRDGVNSTAASTIITDSSQNSSSVTHSIETKETSLKSTVSTDIIAESTFAAEPLNSKIIGKRIRRWNTDWLEKVKKPLQTEETANITNNIEEIEKSSMPIADILFDKLQSTKESPAENESVPYTTAILTSPQKSKSDSELDDCYNLLSLYGPSELEMIETISKVWLCNKYQFSKRLKTKIKSESANIDHLIIKDTNPVPELPKY